jgi:hypothetical protein
MITTANIQDQALSWFSQKMPNLALMMKVYFRDGGDLMMLTVCNTSPEMNESNLWECQSARIDIMDKGTFKLLAYVGIELQISELLNQVAAEMPSIESMLIYN